jgi:hypothetical protein
MSCGDVVVPALGGDAFVTTCTFGLGDEQCDDGNNCTDDVCLADGSCSHDVRSEVCVVGGRCFDDGGANPDDWCALCLLDQSKTSWSVRACDDSNDCTGDTCDPDGQDCVFAPLSDIACDDGQDCSDDDRCEVGVCVATPC